MGFDSRILTLCLLVLPTNGCVTGELFEAARMHERVWEYERITIDAEQVHLDYTTEIATNLEADDTTRTVEDTPRTSHQAAVFALSALTVRPAYPVDEFPLRRVRAASNGGQPVEIHLIREDEDKGGKAESDRDRSTGFDSDAPFVARVDDENGRHRGFYLCPTTADPCFGYFYSEALYDDPIAWWAYPIAPFTFAIDLAILPIQVFTLPILIASGD